MTIGRVTIVALASVAIALLLTALAASLGSTGALAQEAATETSAPPDAAQADVAPAFAPDGKVRAVLFYSPNCPHCHTVRYEDLPPIQAIFGDQLQIVYLNTYKDYADLLYDLTNTTFEVRRRDRGVPMMVVGDHVMIGAGDIRTNLPPLVASYLEQGGVDWPAIPGLRDVIGMQEAVAGLTEQPPSGAPTSAPQAPPPAAGQPVHGAPGVGPTPAPVTEPGTGAASDASGADEGEDAETRAGSEVDDNADAGADGGDGDTAAPGTVAGADDDTTAPSTAAGTDDDGAAANSTDDGSSAAPGDAAATSAALALADVKAMPTLPASAFLPPEELSVGERFMLDPTGNSISVIVLLLMIVCLIAALRPAAWQQTLAASKWPRILIPLLAVAGIIVAAYLAYIETTLSEAYCGPVGDCNAVQQSDYARLFGLPIAWLGLAGYVAVLGLWAVAQRATEATARWAWAFLYVVAIIGVLFSMYLTFLEPFVIGATCAWCLTSAVLMTAILLLSAGKGHEALRAEPPPPAAASA